MVNSWERDKAGDLLPGQRAAVKITPDILTRRQLCSVFHFTVYRKWVFTSSLTVVMVISMAAPINRISPRFID
jgi:hypothetical protein